MEKEYIIESNGTKRLAVHKICERCGKDFLVRKSWKDKQKFCSKECLGDYNKKRKKVYCSYCGIEFEKSLSKLKNSKSGLYFCCREHKDLAQRLEFGCKEIMPEHYNNGNGSSSYRERALKELPNICNRCGYNKNIKILQVHHKDHNRDNNDMANLEILCPNCHCEEHWG